jgi:hypothetical protein
MIAHRAVPKLIAMGVANGILIGAALATSHPVHYLLVAIGAGTFINVTWFVSSRWRGANETAGTK